MKKLSSLTSFSLSADKHVWIPHRISSHSNNTIHQILIKASNSLTLYLVLLPLLLKTACNLLKAQHLFEFVVKITCTEVNVSCKALKREEKKQETPLVKHQDSLLIFDLFAQFQFPYKAIQTWQIQSVIQWHTEVMNPELHHKKPYLRDNINITYATNATSSDEKRKFLNDENKLLT